MDSEISFVKSVGAGAAALSSRSAQELVGFDVANTPLQTREKFHRELFTPNRIQGGSIATEQYGVKYTTAKAKRSGVKSMTCDRSCIETRPDHQ